MAEVVAGLLTSAVVKIAGDKLSSAIAQQANLCWNFSDDLEDMKDTMESMAAVFKDAEKRSVKEEVVRLCLKRLKYAAFDISDMMDDYLDTGKGGSTANKMSGMLSCFTASRKKMVLANKMKKMREELKRINDKFRNFNFTPNPTATTQDHQPYYDERQTIPVVNEARILGRDGEKKEIIDILSASHRKDGTMVLPIHHGLGGIGKSTLAQLVFNDTQFITKYEHKAWVYVSEVYDLNKIQRTIVSQLSKDGGDLLDELLLSGKKILIVLDDIWQEDSSELNKLKDMLYVDRKGSMVDVLVTTRSESIANKICTTRAPYKLKPLGHNVCWDIIKRCSEFENKSNKHKLTEIGLDIAKKCGGVALAALALGELLKLKDLDGWSEINNSEIWNESFGVGDKQLKKVLPSLMLSYEHMQQTLRLCFSYCAIFPKGHDIDEDDLVHQWMALDFIKKPSEGKEYINQLLGMSFFQHSKLPTISGERVMWYTMHDLVHDLARSVVGDELIVIDVAAKLEINQQKYCRYALLINYDGETKLSDILPEKVRALHFSSSYKLGPSDGSFSFAKRLCILHFSECSGIIFPSSIGQLKQLKCLIAPKLQDKNLPDSIGELSKLQYLNLCGSSLFSALPGSIGKLSCLIHLDLSRCSGILEIPDSFGGLKSLVHLDMSNCSRITNLPNSLGNLTKLKHLDISRCPGVKEIPESLGGLNQLQQLMLSHCGSIGRLPEAIGSLSNLQYLDLGTNPQIRELPGSFRNLQNLVHLNLSDCCCTEGLTDALRGLTSLEHLNMSRFKIDDWTHLSEALGNLTNLKYLNLYRCGVHCVDFIGNLSNLEHLGLYHNINIVSLPECIGNLKKLQTLDLSWCTRLKSLPESIGNLRNLYTLNLSYCQWLTSLPDSISEITMLKSVLIEGCSKELEEVIGSKLHYSLTLPDFKVRSDVVSACSNLPLLEGTNVDKLVISSLENVRSVEEARKVKLLDKNKLSALTLSWTSENADRFVEDEDSLGQLVPPIGLESLGLKGYNGKSFPSWFMDISHHLPNLVCITLDSLPKCNNLPPLGQLPNLEKLSLTYCASVVKIGKDFCGGRGAFPRLSTFVLFHMDRLKEWCTTYSVEDGAEEFMFPVLDKLEIESCQKLRLTPCPPICRDFKIQSCDQIIPSLEELGNNIGHLTSSTPTTKLRISFCNCRSLRLFHHFAALQELDISNCNNLTTLPESMRDLTSLKSLDLQSCDSISALPDWLGNLTSLESLAIRRFGHLKSLPESMQDLTSLQSLALNSCDSLSTLPEWLGDLSSLQRLAIVQLGRLKSLPESMRHLKSLHSLVLRYCNSISALPDWLGDLSSLKNLTIQDCKGIKSLPPCIQQLTNLQKLRIQNSLELKRWCESEENKKKIAHINNIIYEEPTDRSVFFRRR